MRWFTILILILVSGTTALSADGPDAHHPVTSSHLKTIATLFRENGLNGATPSLGRNGRVVIGGSFRDSQEVQEAYSLAMSVVGAKWTSPVNAADIEVWERGRKYSAPVTAPAVADIERQTARKQADAPKEGFALIVGIGLFKSEGITRLRYAADDARRFYDYLSRDAGKRFKKDNIKLLTDEEATAANIQRALADLRDRAGRNDDIIIYFSSHGLPAFDGSMNIVAHDTEYTRKSKNRSMQTSISAKTVNDFLHSVEAQRVLVVYDVCYSGAAFKNAGSHFQDVTMPVDTGEDNTGFSKDAMASSLLGAKDIVFDEDVVKTSTDTDNTKLKIVVSASSADEKSWESDTIRSSIFTYYFVKALRSSGNVKLAFDVARERVSYLVKQEKNAEQHPQVISSNRRWNDFLIDN